MFFGQTDCGIQGYLAIKRGLDRRSGIFENLLRIRGCRQTQFHHFFVEGTETPKSNDPVNSGHGAYQIPETGNRKKESYQPVMDDHSPAAERKLSAFGSESRYQFFYIMVQYRHHSPKVMRKVIAFIENIPVINEPLLKNLEFMKFHGSLRGSCLFRNPARGQDAKHRQYSENDRQVPADLAVPHINIPKFDP
ncbi:MAG: hypothetical protein BWY42_01443 [Candidatus Omnitrophica bacterium ADurb.Bin277]|nr:MAG: hypothetical protein BWY42_01443 [Candidatus Omnitrophica bacterium ADurb.Bin277]